MTISAPPARLLNDASLFLDLDGTILQLAESPGAVVASDRALHVLRLANERLAGRVAIISGRSADNVSALFPGLAMHISGSHGLEILWPDGRRVAPSRAEALDHALLAMRALEAEHEGLLVEAKPYGVALHYRLAPHLEDACRTLAERLSAETGLPLQPGKMVQELKSAAGNKGDALAAFMAQAPMTGGTPVFLGDDDNDEPAFAAAARLGGAGILVGPERRTAASWRLPGVEAALGWLEAGLGEIA